eukprot:TRINITY_DN13114_c0_g1_i1.p1 TRINITY_DN13114_c0_g1~~TRINITY_DN13114_c0_g1_i1.p1  ORF type:complete len:125 (-),score=7.36 TRINITY_DN13114_c0_g1_i1:14-388(-)
MPDIPVGLLGLKLDIHRAESSVQKLLEEIENALMFARNVPEDIASLIAEFAFTQARNATKPERVEKPKLEEKEELDLMQEVNGSFLVRCSSLTGEGLDELVREIVKAMCPPTCGIRPQKCCIVI